MSKRFIHIPTKKVYYTLKNTNHKVFLVNDDVDVTFPLWITDNSEDWFEIEDKYPTNEDGIDLLIQLNAVKKDNRRMLEERGWGSLTDDEFSFYFNHLKDIDYFKNYDAKKIKEAYAEFKKNQKISNKLN